MRILVINADRDMAIRIERMLANDHISIETNANGARLRILDAEQAGSAFSAILCDVGIDSSCGVDILDLSCALRDPPLFVFTATYVQFDAVAGLGDGILIHPFEPGELLTTLARLMLEKQRNAPRVHCLRN